MSARNNNLPFTFDKMLPKSIDYCISSRTCTYLIASITFVIHVKYNSNLRRILLIHNEKPIFKHLGIEKYSFLKSINVNSAKYLKQQ